MYLIQQILFCVFLSEPCDQWTTCSTSWAATRRFSIYKGPKQHTVTQSCRHMISRINWSSTQQPNIHNVSICIWCLCFTCKLLRFLTLRTHMRCWPIWASMQFHLKWNEKLFLFWCTWTSVTYLAAQYSTVQSVLRFTAKPLQQTLNECIHLNSGIFHRTVGLDSPTCPQTKEPPWVPRWLSWCWSSNASLIPATPISI